MKAQWMAGASSQQGRRSENQDRMTRFSCALGEVIVVADGMGGQRGGATAAAMAASRLPELLRTTAAGLGAAESLQDAVQKINKEIYDQGHGEDHTVRGMGTTIVLAVVRETEDGAEALIGNIGDSRAYLVRSGALQQITKDHTVVQRLVDAGVISAEQAKRHPDSSVLSRAMGQQPDVELEFYPPLKMGAGDGLLLCSDGLSGFADAHSIAAELRKTDDANKVVAALHDLAMRNGSDDNVTIQYLQLVPPAAAPKKPRRRSKFYAGAAAAVVLLAMAAVTRLCACKPPLENVEIVIQNATGEKPPLPKREEAPGEKRTETRPAAIVYARNPSTRDVQALIQSGCADVKHEEPGKLDQSLRNDRGRRLYFRPGAEKVRDCIVQKVKLQHVIQTDRLPPGVQAILVADDPEERDAD